jgi:hypothetical protein
MRIASVTRIDGPAGDEHRFFLVTRYDGLLGWLRGRKLIATVRLERTPSGWHSTYWGTSSEQTCEAVCKAVDRYDRKLMREAELARARGDAHWHPYTPHGAFLAPGQGDT